MRIPLHSSRTGVFLGKAFHGHPSRDGPGRLPPPDPSWASLLDSTT